MASGDNEDRFYAVSPCRRRRLKWSSPTLPHPLFTVFSEVDQHLPATLIRLLLQRAGIESNPGPTQWPCSTCKKSAAHNSVRCSGCTNWVHLAKKCSQLNAISDYAPATYICPACRPAPVPLRDVRVPAPANAPVDFAVLQLNVNGLRNKANELEALLTERKIMVAALQEMKLSPKQKTPKFCNYTVVRKDRTDRGGGLAILVHHSLAFTEHMLPPLPEDNHLEQMAVNVSTKTGCLTTVNIYVPPDSSCGQGYKPSLSHLLDDGDRSDTLLLGDINAHDALWHSTIADTRGASLAEEMLDSNYGILN